MKNARSRVQPGVLRLRFLHALLTRDEDGLPEPGEQALFRQLMTGDEHGAYTLTLSVRGEAPPLTIMSVETLRRLSDKGFGSLVIVYGMPEAEEAYDLLAVWEALEAAGQTGSRLIYFAGSMTDKPVMLPVIDPEGRKMIIEITEAI
jgi:hypothetical protein